MSGSTTATPPQQPTAEQETASRQHYLHWFRHTAPYINAHRDKTFVLALSGEAVAHANFDNIVHDIALLDSLGVRLVLVHGARPQIDSRLNELGISSQFHNGRRITEQNERNAVIEAASGVRSRIEGLLSMGVANSPMHGAAIRVCGGNFVTAKPVGVIDGIDHGFTGDVRKIDTGAIHQLLAQNNIVLLSNLGYSTTGEVFNLCAEDLAARVAVALGADKLIVFGEDDGLLDENGQLIRECLSQTISDSTNLLPERKAALEYALSHKVSRCHLLSHITDGALLSELFSRDGIGTLFTDSGYESLSQASIDDVGGILEIISPLEEAGVLVKRSRELLEAEIDRFWVIQRDGMVISCAALYCYPDADTSQHAAEIACVATHPDYRGGERAERLLKHIEKQAKNSGISTLFVLTTQTAHWFQEQGFTPSSLETLPSGKLSLYNYQRNAKVFSKAVE